MHTNFTNFTKRLLLVCSKKLLIQRKILREKIGVREQVNGAKAGMQLLKEFIRAHACGGSIGFRYQRSRSARYRGSAAADHVATNRADQDAGRFSGIDGQQQLLRGLVTSQHEIATGFVKVLQGTAGPRFSLTAGHGDFLLRARIVKGPITNITHKDHTLQKAYCAAYSCCPDCTRSST